jgi:predicted enzyme related to lactoylglutathione lyase
VYFATDDADETARKVEAAGGKVVVAPFDVLDQGRMAVFADNTGAFFSVWQAGKMAGLGRRGEPNTFGWCELATRGVDRAAEFYAQIFGWKAHRSEASEGGPRYIEWQLDGRNFGGAIDMDDLPDMPADTPPFWLPYFISTDVNRSAERARELGGVIQMGPQAYPGGTFAIIDDPVGAHFGLMHDTAGS